MSDYLLRLRQDRALRDAARALVKADIDHLRDNLEGRGIGSRVVERISEGAKDVFEEAVEVADNNRGIFAALIGALLIWFARHPLMDLITGEDDDDRDDAR